MHIWSYIQEAIGRESKVALLYVVDSQGSSPGRQGFRMVVTQQGNMIGSIGGGIMEHKLVELAKNILRTDESKIIFKRQIHSKDVGSDQSGLICSGAQSVVILALTLNDKSLIDEIVSHLRSDQTSYINISPKGIHVDLNSNQALYNYSFTNENNWQYTEKLGLKKQAYIIGGGHVSQALSQTLRELDFYCTVIDDRNDLHTLDENLYAHQKLILDYHNLQTHISEGPNVYVFIMTFGYRSDLIVLQQLINKSLGFLGMMGSKEKVRRLMDDMKSLGYTDQQLDKVESPIGIDIKSRTPNEIAISIGARVIQIQNKHLP